MLVLHVSDVLWQPFHSTTASNVSKCLNQGVISTVYVFQEIKNGSNEQWNDAEKLCDINCHLSLTRN